LYYLSVPMARFNVDIFNQFWVQVAATCLPLLDVACRIYWERLRCTLYRFLWLDLMFFLFNWVWVQVAATCLPLLDVACSNYWER